MHRALVLPAVFLASLLLAAAAGAAAKDDNVALTVASAGNSQYTFQVQNTGDSVIASFVLVLGPSFTASSLVSATARMCELTGGTVSCAGLALAPGCTCNPGESVYVTISGSGDPAGSNVVQIVGMKAAAPASPSSTSNPVQTVATTTAKAPQTTKPKTKPKTKVPRCKKGQHSTKKKPCHK
jgi:hypothetical protein